MSAEASFSTDTPVYNSDRQNLLRSGAKIFFHANTDDVRKGWNRYRS